MTDKEILKALGCCSKNPSSCVDCNYKGKCNRRDCYDYLKLDALDLINRLQADCENYKQIAEHQQSVTMDRGFEIKRLKEKIESLQAEKYLLEAEVNRYKRYYFNHEYDKLVNEAKAEAYKEFAELLHCQCEGIINQPHNENVRPISWKVAYEEFDEKVDNLLKELVGEDNA